jgi:sugar O-acyltransferase (sialic acid O-acetyltransferase NeuD family)
MIKDNLVIIGAGGHGRVAKDIAQKNGYKKVIFLDDGENAVCDGKVSEFVNYLKDAQFFVAIGNANVREKITEEIASNGGQIATLIHPNAILCDDAVIGEGTLVAAGAVINPNVKIGKGVIINTLSSVDHDSTVGDYTHVAVGAHLCGTVNVGKSVFVGAGAVVINNKNVCDNTTIGAAAAVVKDITVSGTYVGVPARRIK